jgi:hypothetical protein
MDRNINKEINPLYFHNSLLSGWKQASQNILDDINENK